ncbi:helix-turn-helix domain-containing protein [Actinocorallia populi]|uniref:helix-turn-helix domain-containing protein n=1 Tax=Actinocorallia populi TaxID=2079200 RepID=UPI000D088BD9|nr:helix-turn-helix transcriptional regulator [Actinocorallia populi]
MPVYVRDQLDPRLSHWHFLAYAMRMLREQHGLSLSQVGKLLDVTRGTVSNFEAGRRKLCDEYARVLDERYGTGELVQTIAFYARMSHDPDWHRTFTGYELEALSLKIYHGQLIPVPLQTEETVRAQLSAARTVKDLERSVEARLVRQESILHREDPPYVWVLLDESALEQLTGGPKVLRAQLEYLHELSFRPNIGIRVIPRSAGAHIGTDGPIRLAILPDREAAFLGAQRGGRLVESPAEVREVSLDWDFMSQTGHSAEESRALMIRKMEALG